MFLKKKGEGGGERERERTYQITFIGRKEKDVRVG
jgi:hypothetical protein